MKLLTPYTTASEALASLDNGGRLYNLWTEAKDGNIELNELAKVAGVFKDQQKMMLYLDMATYAMDAASHKQVHDALSEDLKEARTKYCPSILSPSQAKLKGEVGTSSIITGIPKYIEAKVEFEGFIIVPVMAGSAMVMIMVPMIDQYNVYHLTDEQTKQDFIIAHTKGDAVLPEKTIRCGGILKELNTEKSGDGERQIFLETLYYSTIN